jgi:hypothetical protein
MQVTPDDAKSQEARAGAELWRSVAAASAVVERRQASALRFSAQPHPLDAAPVKQMRLPAFRFLFIC